MFALIRTGCTLVVGFVIGVLAWEVKANKQQPPTPEPPPEPQEPKQKQD